jgi:hypothetical protein
MSKPKALFHGRVLRTTVTDRRYKAEVIIARRLAVHAGM